MRRKEINEFNAQFTGYADKEIPVQTFADIYNLVEDWNEQNETDKIIIDYGQTSVIINRQNVINYLKGKPEMEEFLSKFFGEDDINIKDYYFKFNSSETVYDDYGRINKITMYMYKKS